MKKQILKTKQKLWGLPVFALLSIFIFFACEHEGTEEQRIESSDSDEDATYSLAKILISNGTELEFFGVKGEKGVGVDEYTRIENSLIKMDDNESFLELYLKVAPENAEIPSKLIEDHGEGAKKLISGRKITNKVSKIISVDMKSVSFEIETKDNTGGTKGSCYLSCTPSSGTSHSTYNVCTSDETGTFAISDAGHKRPIVEALTKACSGKWKHKIQKLGSQQWQTLITRSINSGHLRRTRYHDRKRRHRIERVTNGNSPYMASASSKFFSLGYRSSF